MIGRNFLIDCDFESALMWKMMMILILNLLNRMNQNSIVNYLVIIMTYLIIIDVLIKPNFNYNFNKITNETKENKSE